MICFNEYTEDSNAEVTRISREEAIKRQRLSCISLRGRDIYKSDEEALWDFIVINGAWEEKEENNRI